MVQGQPIIIQCNDRDTANLYNSEQKLLLQIHSSGDLQIKVPTLNHEPGEYVITIENTEGELTQIIPLRIQGLFEKESRIQTLQEQIALVDKVITAKLSDDQGVLISLSINSKNLVYSSLADLTLLVDSLRAQLNAAIQKENRKKGRAPFKQIKLILNRG